jgi:hypothetical protein
MNDLTANQADDQAGGRGNAYPTAIEGIRGTVSACGFWETDHPCRMAEMRNFGEDLGPLGLERPLVEVGVGFGVGSSPVRLKYGVLVLFADVASAHA